MFYRLVHTVSGGRHEHWTEQSASENIRNKCHSLKSGSDTDSLLVADLCSNKQSSLLFTSSVWSLSIVTRLSSKQDDRGEKGRKYGGKTEECCQAAGADNNIYASVSLTPLLILGFGVWAKSLVRWFIMVQNKFLVKSISSFLRHYSTCFMYVSVHGLILIFH